MKVSDSKERCRIVKAECQKIERSDSHFGPWLKDYVKENRRSWLGSGKSHQYWLVPIDLVEDAIDVLAEGHDHCFLHMCYQRAGSDEYLSVLAVAPLPTALDSMWQSLFQALFMLWLKSTDFWFKWGVNRCPQCGSYDLHAFTYMSPDEPQSHYCNGCNTIWPPRA